MASIQELTAQVVALTDQVQTLSNRLSVAQQNATLQTQMGTRGSDSGVLDKKRLYPKELKDSTSTNEEIGDAFQRAGRQEISLDVST